MSTILENVALVGASGNLGSRVLKRLLNGGKHNITVITRPSSTVDVSGVTVHRGDLADVASLEAALHGQDVLVLMFGLGAGQLQNAFLEPASKAGVKHIVPTEYGVHLGDDTFDLPMRQPYLDIHDRIESLGMKWIGVVTNPWIDYGLEYGGWSINIPERKAVIFEDSATFNTTSIEQVAPGIGAMLTLPASKLDVEFGNNNAFLSSFSLTQPELFEAVLRVTRTSREDWTIEIKSSQSLVDHGWSMIEAGEAAGHLTLIYGLTYQPGNLGNYSSRLHNEMLGLSQESLDKVVLGAVKAARSGSWEAA